MSLNIIEMRNTRKEFKSNIALIGLTPKQVADHLAISEEKLVSIIELKDETIENPWIVRNFLIEYAKEHNLKLVPFKKLKGDYHDYFFLDSKYIDNGQIS